MSRPTTQELSRIKTRLLILSDTHGLGFPEDMQSRPSADVAIHCGDLTEHSKLDGFQETFKMMRDIDAPLKLVIAGNHDFSLDIPVFKQKITEAEFISRESLTENVQKEFGKYGAAGKILHQVKDDGIIFLGEGSHTFQLQNGSTLKVYASPYTPSAGGEWGFQYRDGHNFDIEKGTDIVITHGPPHGIMDMSNKKRIGCPDLFAAVAKAQPKVHCFGHVHSGWGAKLATWRPHISDKPSHFSDIDNGKSKVLESVASLQGSSFESAEDKKARQQKLQRYQSQGSCNTSHCRDDEDPIQPGQTLFVNAAIKSDDGLSQLPWLVDIDLEPHATKKINPCCYAMYGIEKENKRKRNTDPPETEQGGERQKRVHMIKIHDP
ncbi:Metallo-dependent phosphatase-like protein [Dactylonectria estremocensis]|uniref:Metallo-dependent phosphatase-like protein n=1 Tax=Dactylonectria estremocensis TaxID=1079267 RepID=A0A9P9FDF3_9HYPO|nr:Metallo-dependent phosphatase-like protein [Dactylonectria estremocensis]